MKLSEMTTRQAATVCVRIAEPVERIMCNERVITSIKDFAASKTKANTPVIEVIGKAIGNVAPVLLGECYADVIVILSALTGKTERQLDEQRLTETVADIKACFDGDLISFFTSRARTGREE